MARLIVSRLVMRQSPTLESWGVATYFVVPPVGIEEVSSALGSVLDPEPVVTVRSGPGACSVVEVHYTDTPPDDSIVKTAIGGI